MASSLELLLEVRTLADVKVEVFGGLRRKTIARSWPPVRAAKRWIRSRVAARLASETVDGERSRTRSWRVVMVLLVVEMGGAASGIATSWVSSLFSMFGVSDALQDERETLTSQLQAFGCDQ